MATKATLKARIREESGKGAARKLRAAGRVPAILYGHGVETRMLSVDALEFRNLISHSRIESTIVTLDIEGGRGREVRALMREVQTHAYKPEVVHVDFYQIRADEKVEVEIAVRLVGTAAGVKEGGILQQVLHDLRIECLPDQIPDAIEVDVSALEVNDSLHVSDLQAPAGVTILAEPERTICSVVEPTVVALEEEPEEIEGVGGEVEPELIRERPEPGEAADATELGEASGSRSNKGEA